MAITPINLSRISNNLRTDTLLAAMRRNSADLLLQQNKVSLGRSFVTPSDDPIAASQTLVLNQSISKHDQILLNAQHADSFLQATDAALLEVNDLLIQASSIASQSLAALASEDERAANADLVAGIVDQLMAIGNRTFQGRYLFGGRNTNEAPFASALGGVAYMGDTGELFTRVAEEDLDAFNIPGDQVFGALSTEIQGSETLDPMVSSETRLEDLIGANGRGVAAGVLVFDEQGGAGRFEVDLASADTVGDVIDLINEAAANAGADLTASLGTYGLNIDSGGNSVTILDNSEGIVAGGLGVLNSTAVSGAIPGLPLGRRVTGTTLLSELNGGAGIDLSSPIMVTNGTQTVDVDLSQATTVQDVLNILNNLGLHLRASINDSGTGINVLNQVSGSSLSIGENGGATATALGIRTLTTSTPLDQIFVSEDSLSDEAEPDFLITAKDGSSFEVNLSGLTSMGEVIDAINTEAQSAGVNVTASLVTVGNGIVLQDGTSGTGSLSVTNINQSFAADDLGVAKIVADPATELVGDDPSSVRVDSVFTALLDLAEALRQDSDGGITDAGDRLNQFTSDITRARGIVGARSAAMQRRLEQADSSVYQATAEVATLSGLDFAEGITQLEQAQAAFQASLLVGSRIIGVSLLDYLA